jgi:hypothetical protein
MGRYVITLVDGERIEADDARWGAQRDVLEYITRYDHEYVVLNRDLVKDVRHRRLGNEGGKRFTGRHDTSFDRTPGSI